MKHENLTEQNLVLKSWCKGGVMAHLLCDKRTGMFTVIKPIGNPTNLRKIVSQKIAGFILSSNLSRYSK